MTTTTNILRGGIGLVLSVVVGLTGFAHAKEGDGPMDVGVMVSAGPEAEVSCTPMDSLATSIGMLMKFGKAGPVPEQIFTLHLYPGDLLMVGAVDVSVVYPFAGTEERPLAFAVSDGLVKLNGDVVGVDLSEPAGAESFAALAEADLAQLRSLKLGGQKDVDAAALGRVPGGQVIIQTADDVEAEYVAGLVDAMAAARPIGLFLSKDFPLAEHLARFEDLQYVGLPWAPAAESADLSKARFLMVAFSGEGEAPSLAPLGELAALETLHIEELGTGDLSVLAELPKLRTLSLKGGDAADVSGIPRLSTLRKLDLMGFENLTNLSGIEEFDQLTHLAIFPVPEELTDLTPLESLENLDILLVDNDSLKAREAEYDQLREALPDTEIVGFCVGSRWLLVVLAVGVVGGLGVRYWRRRARVRPAA